MKASGTFSVNMAALDTSFEGSNGNAFARMALDKQFSGDLSATSKGEMLSLQCSEGSAGYVAIEQVSGVLAGKKGGFSLQHFGTMSEKGSNLLLEVIPDSGSGELKEISGSMSIRIEDGNHFYTFEYELA
jgi:hypothetical protein